jgi:hypothetical protein
MPDSIRPVLDATTQFAPVRAISPAAPPQPAADRPERAARQGAAAPQPALLMDGDLVIEIDKDAGRIVHRVLDSETGATIRQYPSETELAFSRALAAAERAKRDVTV